MRITAEQVNDWLKAHGGAEDSEHESPDQVLQRLGVVEEGESLTAALIDVTGSPIDAVILATGFAIALDLEREAEHSGAEA